MGLLQLFPREQRGFWERVAGDEESIQEIRLRVGKPVLVCRNGREYFLDGTGAYTGERGKARRMEGGELEALIQHICHYSLYAFEDELRQGFITVPGGHRIGLAGQAVLEEEGRLRTVKHITCLNIRLSHEVKGAADGVLPKLYENGTLLNTLIVSPPGCGKTTLLRDLVRQISDGNPWGKGMCVGVVDERSEIAGCCQGLPQNDVGIRTDVLDACPKALGMMLLLRSMSPQVLAIDELGGVKDMEAVRTASSCGCRLLATLHGNSLEDIRRKAGMEDIFRERIFERFLLLGKREGRCQLIDMQGKEFYEK